MSETSHADHHEQGKSHANPAGHDGMSDATVNNGTLVSKENEQRMMTSSKVLKLISLFTPEPGTPAHKIKPSIIHTHCWIHTISTDVIIFNNKND